MLVFTLAYWGRIFLFELKKPKGPFEINWPLTGAEIGIDQKYLQVKMIDESFCVCTWLLQGFTQNAKDL